MGDAKVRFKGIHWANWLMLIGCCIFLGRHVVKLFTFDYSPFPHANVILIQFVGVLTATLCSAAFCKGCLRFARDQKHSFTPIVSIMSFLMIDDLLPKSKPDLVHAFGSIAICIGFSGIACILAFLPERRQEAT